ncbi:hypothetical protein KM043_007226 [Ampulex compressa]|nr:hypothetical protein KM043_007226 [Ampulex compressa]
MLVSKVLMQEALDVKPYRINHEWYLAQYPAASYDVNCIDKFNGNVYLKKNMGIMYPEPHISKIIQCRAPKCTDYEDIPTVEKSICNVWTLEETEKYDQYLLNGTSTSETSEISEIHTMEECNDYDDQSTSNRLSRSTSKSSYLQNYTDHIKQILKSVNSKTCRMILRWINIDENTVGDEINIFDEAESPKKIEDTQSQSTIACNCVQTSLTLPALLQYINGTPIDVLLNKEDMESVFPMDICQCERCETI